MGKVPEKTTRGSSGKNAKALAARCLRCRLEAKLNDGGGGVCFWFGGLGWGVGGFFAEEKRTKKRNLGESGKENQP